MGPKIEPCGTPYCAFLSSEDSPFMKCRSRGTLGSADSIL